MGLQGPYFYAVYASKMFGGAPASMEMVSRIFLTGFASTALFGPAVGRAIDTYGRKKGTLAFFAFEACVGMYFPSIGTLRSKYIPDSHRSVIMNLSGIPLNILVVSVFLFVKYLGVNGALGISSCALGLATLCMVKLNAVRAKDPVLT